MHLPEFTFIEQTKNLVVVNITLDKNARAFDGHFPGHPVLPGVVQLDWVMQLAHMFFAVEPVAKDFQVKFTDMITTGSITLRIEFEPELNRLSFNYSKEDKTCSSGKVKLGKL